MIIGVGIDIINVNRMEKWINNPDLLKRFFHPEELTYALSKGKRSAMSLSARFAAKEAFAKALGTGFAGLVLKDIMVLNKPNGKPEIMLCGTAKEAMDAAGVLYAHVSLTHEKDNAVAMIVLEGA